MDDAGLHALDDTLQLHLLCAGYVLDQNLCLIGVLVFEERHLAEDLVNFLLVEDEVLTEHLLELEFLPLGLLALVAAHLISIIIKRNTPTYHNHPFNCR
jgi:hypothetical protein